MRLQIFILVIIICGWTNATCQIDYSSKPAFGKLLITENLDEITFVNDSLVKTSFPYCNQWFTLSFHEDSLYFTNSNCSYASKLKLGFKVLLVNKDSIFIEGAIWNSTKQIVEKRLLKFIDLDKLVDSIYNFKSLSIDFLPNEKTSYYKRAIINNKRELLVGRLGQDTTSYKHFEISEKQFSDFIDTLSNSMIFFLPAHRQCGIDAKYNAIDISVNNKIIHSTGCHFDQVHYKVYKYVMRLVDSISQ